ncbi:oligosaccharide flippase family protein [Aeromonas veronii]
MSGILHTPLFLSVQFNYMKKNKLISFSIGPIVSAILALVTLPIMSWLFTQEAIGRYSILQVAVTCFSLMLAMGLDQAYVRFFQTEDKKGELLKIVMLPGLSVFILTLFVLVISGFRFSEFLYDYKNSYLDLLFVLCVFFTFVNSILTLILRMNGLGWAFSFSQIIPKFMMLLLLLLMFFLSKRNNSFLSLNIFLCISLGSSFLFFSFINRNEILNAAKSIFNKSKFMHYFKFGFPLFGATFFYWMLTSVDRFYIKYLSSLSELAIYSVAASFASVVSVVIAVFGNLWHPTVYKWHADAVPLEKYKTVMDLITIVVVVIWSMFGVFSSLLIYVLPSDYESISYIVVGCVAAPLMYLLSESTVIGIGISKKTGYAFCASFSAMLVNLMLNYLLIPSFGAVGAVFSSMISFYIFFILRTEFSVHLWNTFPRFKMYFIIFVYLLFSSINIFLYQFNFIVIGSGFKYFISLFWLLLMFSCIALYRKSIVNIFCYFKINYLGDVKYANNS